jgi:Asp-tRNA(Asn)/Glu-tRNA(Gln) amidotransferase A subunit family amidase
MRDLRLAVAPTLPGAKVAAKQRERVERIAAQAGGGGARIVERLADVDWPALNKLFGDLIFATTGIFDPTSKLRDEQRTLGWYLEALERRDRLIAAWQAFFEDVDAIVLPAATSGASRHGETVSEEEGQIHAFSNLTGLPALAVPAGLDDEGLPIGIQLVGPLWSEMRLVAIARELERAGILPGFQAPALPSQ